MNDSALVQIVHTSSHIRDLIQDRGREGMRQNSTSTLNGSDIPGGGGLHWKRFLGIPRGHRAPSREIQDLGVAANHNEYQGTEQFWDVIVGSKEPLPWRKPT